jgi:ribosomal-protein-alanine N-acetyltransferase
MIIVKMSESHIPQIAELEKLCFNDPWSENSIASELGNKLALWLVAEHEGQILGYVGSQTVLGETDMMNIATHPDFRRRGCASALIDALEEFLSSKGVDSIFLEVRVSNTPARALYEGKGFSVVGTRKNYYRFPTEDAAVMLKTIS